MVRNALRRESIGSHRAGPGRLPLCRKGAGEDAFGNDAGVSGIGACHGLPIYSAAFINHVYVVLVARQRWG